MQSLGWVWLEAAVLGLKRKDQRCQFGFGGGSRPLVFFRWCLLMEQLDLGLQAGLLQTSGKGPEALEGPEKRESLAVESGPRAARGALEALRGP